MFVHRIREMESSPYQHLRQFMENSVEKCILMLGCQGLKLKVLWWKAEVRCDCVGQGWVTLNPLNLQSDQSRIFPYSINTLTSRLKWWGYRKISIRGLLVDPIPSSPDLHHENCMLDREENYWWDLGIERVNSDHDQDLFYVPFF